MKYLWTDFWQNVINQRDYLRREKEAQMEAMAELERQRRKQWVEDYLTYGPGQSFTILAILYASQ